MRKKKVETNPREPKTSAKTKHPSKKKSESQRKAPLPPVHPWRVCPYGEHWVKTHPLTVPPSETNPDGSMTTRHEHCAHNPSGKDQLYPEEIQEIANQNFSNAKNKPCGLDLGFPNKGWLFEKRHLASVHLKKNASWVETVWEYKGTKVAKSKKDVEKIKRIFNGFYEELQKCGRN